MLAWVLLLRSTSSCGSRGRCSRRRGRRRSGSVVLVLLVLLALVVVLQLAAFVHL